MAKKNSKNKSLDEHESDIESLKKEVAETQRYFEEIFKLYEKFKEDIEQYEQQLLTDKDVIKNLEINLKKERENRTSIALALSAEQHKVSELEERLKEEIEARKRLETNKKRRGSVAEEILKSKKTAESGYYGPEIKVKLDGENTKEDHRDSDLSVTPSKSGTTSNTGVEDRSVSVDVQKMDNIEDLTINSFSLEQIASAITEITTTIPENIGNKILDAIESNDLEQALRYFELKFQVDGSDQLESFQKGLYLASALGHFDIVNCFLNKGVDPNFFMPKETSLHKAAECGHYSTCKVLLKAGLEVDVQTKNTGMTPLHLASMNGHLEVCELLISYKASVRAKDMTGSTPLHYAVRSDNLSLVKLIIRESTDLATMNNYGLTPYDYVKNLSVVQMEDYLNLIYSNTAML